MIRNYSLKMTQYLVMVCWLLAVGRGSGLTGKSQSGESSPKASPELTSSSQPPTQVFNYSQVNPTQLFNDQRNNTTSILGVTIQTNYAKSSSTTPEPATETVSVTSYFVTRKLPTKPSATKQPETTTRNPKQAKNVVGKQELPGKEILSETPQNAEREVFIRRKHKGPYYTSEKGSPRPTREPLIITNRSSTPTSNASVDNVQSVTTSGFKLKNSTRNLSFRVTKNPKHTEVVSSTVKRVTTKRPKSFRKRPISMGIPASSTVLLVKKTTSTQAPTPESYNGGDSDEYYASYGEYQDQPVVGYNRSGFRETDLVPDPDLTGGVETIAEAEAEVVLPDDSLADTDLHDHDLIDSVMYIYFGSSERDERGAGRQLLIVGAVISLVGQSLTLISVLRRLRARPDESASLILLNAELALTAANLVFMLGVQATGSQGRCELVAVTLHYLHLVACCWFLVNSLFTYRSLHHSDKKPRLRPWWLAAWCGPALVVLLCVMFNRRGYETHAYCWMSVARGMLYSFLVPLAVLMMLNTCLTVLGLRQLSMSPKAEDVDRKNMRVSATLLPAFAVVWFLGVVALENSASLIFPSLFLTCSNFLNWFVLACWLPADMSLWKEGDEDYDEDDDDIIYEEVLKNQSDSLPLLEEPVYMCGRRADLQMDPICTISS